MAFQGYHLKKGNSFFPSYLIAYEGYESTPNMQQDQNSYRNGKGIMIRNILPHEPSKIWLTTVELTEKEKLLIQTFLPNRKRVELTYWNEGSHSYHDGTFYVPDIKYIQKIATKNTILYKELSITLIEY